MKTKKYKDLVEQRTRKTLVGWSLQETVPEKEIYRFLHNLRGTAGTVGLDKVEDFAAGALLSFSDGSQRDWTEAEWGSHLYPVLKLFAHTETEGTALTPIGEFTVQGGVKQQYEILLIDDDVELVAFLRESLEKQSYYVSIALSAERGLKLFYESKPDMILLDILLPDLSGIDVLQQIIDKAKKERIPIIIISGEHAKDIQLYAYSLGVMDYVHKPVDIDLFLMLIKNRFELKREWQKTTVVDELTGAYNRKFFNQTLKRLVHDFNRSGRIFSMALLDLDHFKLVNDTYGHLMGDEVLQAFTMHVQRSIRVEDTFCRFGGEEFALFMPNTSAESATILLQRIHERFTANRFKAKNEEFSVTFSCGITEIRETQNNPELLIDEADKALYFSKNTGRNRTTLYSEQLPESRGESLLSVIIVDDDPLIRGIVTQHFNAWQPEDIAGVKVTSYSSGKEFLQAPWYSSEERYVILLDGIMPELDGLEVLEQIRSGYTEDNVLVIMLTGRNDQRDIIHALQLGADDYVVKPFHMPELFSRIERLAHRFLF